jgi:hypothetical protein
LLAPRSTGEPAPPGQRLCSCVLAFLILVKASCTSKCVHALLFVPCPVPPGRAAACAQENRVHPSADCAYPHITPCAWCVIQAKTLFSTCECHTGFGSSTGAAPRRETVQHQPQQQPWERRKRTTLRIHSLVLPSSTPTGASPRNADRQVNFTHETDQALSPHQMAVHPAYSAS